MRASKEARIMKAWREQVARLVAEAMSKGECEWCNGRRVDGGHDCPACGGRFDVALVRSYAESLIAEGEGLEAERVAFMDWTRTQGYEGCPPGVGMGPENRERGAFDKTALMVGDGQGGGVPLYINSGGWPGPLAREWGWETCKACANKMLWHEARCIKRERTKDIAVAHFEGEGWTVTVHEEPWGWRLTCSRPAHQGPNSLYRRWNCKACGNRRRVRRHGREAAAANGGAWMIRAGRRLLDTLDGRCPWAPSAVAQASECERCADGICQPGGDFVFGVEPGQSVTVGGPAYMGDGGRLRSSGGRVVGLVMQDFGGRAAVRLSTPVPLSRICGDERPPPNPDCEDCRGTGHNLSGTLPPVEHCMRTVVRARDGDIAAERLSGTQTAQWQVDVLASADPGLFEVWVRMSRPPTRVAPRGEHRQADSFYRPGLMWMHDELPPLDVRITARGLSTAPARNRLPRWRRGELRHSEQRRERDSRQAIGWAREVRADGSVVVDLDL